MTPYVRMFGTIVIVAVAVPAVPPSARATIYQCLDPSGAQVLTDTPAQLRNCTALNAGNPAASASPAQPSGRASGPLAAGSLNSVPTPAPTAAFDPSVSEVPPASPSPSSASPSQPPVPAASEPSMVAAPSSSAPEVPKPAPCAPGLNPFNPFAFSNCQPSGSSPPSPPATGSGSQIPPNP